MPASGVVFWALVILVLIYSIILHEIAHGIAAFWLGDDTAAKAGRLSLNPIKHVHPVGTLLVPFLLYITHSPVLFAWALPVPVNPLKFTKLQNPRIAMALCALAGPLANLLLAMISCLVMRTFSQNPYVLIIAVYGLKINLLLAAFNLMPVPPLDGASIAGLFMPDALYKRYMQIARYGTIVLLLLLFSGFFVYILYPMMEFLMRLICGM